VAASGGIAERTCAGLIKESWQKIASKKIFISKRFGDENSQLYKTNKIKINWKGVILFFFKRSK